jgi:hypothetical protein
MFPTILPNHTDLDHSKYRWKDRHSFAHATEEYLQEICSDNTCGKLCIQKVLKMFETCYFSLTFEYGPLPMEAVHLVSIALQKTVSNSLINLCSFFVNDEKLYLNELKG